MTYDLEIVRGTSNSFAIEVETAAGEPLTLESGQALVFAIKKRPKDEERLLIKKITHAVKPGKFYLELVPNDTLEFEPGKYYYDIGLQQGTSVFYNVIEASVFEIKPNIAKCGDGC